jgi:predicted nucleic acid-binding protein
MWIVDTCVVLDVFESDAQFGRDSAELLEKMLPDGLAVSPITMVELSAAFDGDIIDQKRFLEGAGTLKPGQKPSGSFEKNPRSKKSNVG